MSSRKKESSAKELDEILNLARCADINLDNLAHEVAGLDQSPMFKIVKFQLAEILGQNKDIAQVDPDQTELPLPPAGAIPT